MKSLDANIFLRYLVRPVTTANQARQLACGQLFERLRTGREQVTTCEAIIAEVIFVLIAKAHYDLSHQDAAARLRPILTLRGLKLPHKRRYLRALDLFANSPRLDFEDALLSAHVEREQPPELYSYDTDFDALPSVTRLEP